MNGEFILPELLQYGIGGAALVLGTWIGRSLGAVEARLLAVESRIEQVRAEVHEFVGRRVG